MSEARRQRREAERQQAQQRLHRALAARRNPVEPARWYQFWTSPRKMGGLLIASILALVMGFPIFASAPGTAVPTPVPIATPILGPTPPTQLQAPAMTLKLEDTYGAIIATTAGAVKVSLDARRAPQAVNSFAYLAQQSFYKSSPVSISTPNVLVTMGTRPDTAGPGYGIPPEANTKLQIGSVVLMNQGDGTLGSQFAIVLDDIAALQPPYTVIGRVTEGLDIVRRLQASDSISAVAIFDNPPLPTPPESD